MKDRSVLTPWQNPGPWDHTGEAGKLPGMIKALIAVPVFNEERNISHLLSRLEQWKEDVLVIDDASRDKTARLVTEMGFQCISRKSNIGLSGFYLTAKKHALKNNYTHLISIDGDGQHDPAYIPEFIYALQKYDLVSGNRFHETSVIPESKLASNTFARLLFKTFLNLDFPDVACGFRAIRLNSLTGKFHVPRFGIIYEMLAQHALSGKSTGFVNIPAIYPENEILTTRTSEITGLLSTVYLYRPDPAISSIIMSLKNHSDFRVKLFDKEFESIYQKHGAYRFTMKN